MKLGVYQRFLFLFLIVFGSQALFIAAQDPIELPEGVPPESEWAYGQHLGQVEEMMSVSDLAARARQLESFMKKLHPDSKILQYYESFFSRTVDDYQSAGQTQEARDPAGARCPGGRRPRADAGRRPRALHGALR